jgi:hypothetical protein
MPEEFQLLTKEDFQRPVRQTTRPRISDEERAYYTRLITTMQEHGSAGARIPLKEGEDAKRVKMLAKRIAKEAGVPIRFVRGEKGSNALKLRIQTDEDVEQNRERGNRLRSKQAHPAEISAESSGNGAEAPSRRRTPS